MRWRGAPAGKQLAFESFGVRYQVGLGDPDLEPRVREILPPGSEPRRPKKEDPIFELRRAGDDAYEVKINDAVWIANGTAEVAMTLLDAQIRVHIAVNTPDWIFVHAGVVALGPRALVIPGGSFSGKTTLVGALVRAGATYYSDEYAVLDPEGHVLPYARRLSFRGEEGDLDVSELGGLAGTGKADIAALVLTRYEVGAAWHPERCSPGRGLVALLANTVPAVDRPRQSLDALRRAIDGTIVLEGERGEAAPVAAALVRELAPVSC